MSTRLVATVGVLLFLAGCGAKGVQDVKESLWPATPGETAPPPPAPVPDYAIQFKDLAVDEVAHITQTRTEETGTEMTDPAGKVVTDPRVLATETLVYTQTIQEMSDQGQPTRLRRHYERAERQAGRKLTPLAIQGKTILIEMTPRGWQFHYEGGGELSANDVLLLRREFHARAPVQRDELNALLPKKRVKVGETWEPDAEFMARERQKAQLFNRDPAKVIGRCKLERVYDQNGRQFGVVEFRFEFPTYPGSQDNGARVIQTVTLDGCIDGTSATLSSTTEHRTNLGTQTGANNARMTMFNQTTAKHSRKVTSNP